MSERFGDSCGLRRSSNSLEFLLRKTGILDFLGESVDLATVFPMAFGGLAVKGSADDLFVIFLKFFSSRKSRRLVFGRLLYNRYSADFLAADQRAGGPEIGFFLRKLSCR